MSGDAQYQAPTESQVLKEHKKLTAGLSDMDCDAVHLVTPAISVSDSNMEDQQKEASDVDQDGSEDAQDMLDDATQDKEAEDSDPDYFA